MAEIEQKRMLDLFSGRFGWSKVFAAKGWKCICIDLVEPNCETPEGCTFLQKDVLTVRPEFVRQFDFVCSSSPCEQFSVWGMKHFHPNPKWPDMGLKLFNHTREVCESANIPYVMENVRSAQKFVGDAVHHCGPFYLWGNAVPPLVSQGINKGLSFKRRDGSFGGKGIQVCELMYGSKIERAAKTASIPLELATCVADYAEALLNQRIGITK